MIQSSVLEQMFYFFHFRFLFISEINPQICIFNAFLPYLINFQQKCIFLSLIFAQVLLKRCFFLSLETFNLFNLFIGL